MPFIVVGVTPSVPWTRGDVRVDFDGQSVLLRPGSDTLMPSVVVEYDAANDGEQRASRLARRFFSALAWAEDGGVRDEIWSGGGVPIFIGRSMMGEVTVLGQWRADYLPAPQDEAARLGLALYREAVGLKNISVPYAFLGFFKIITIARRSKDDQIAWIAAAIPRLKDFEALDRLRGLQADGGVQDVAAYLYISGRSAVAHASMRPVVNPDDPGHLQRLGRDLPVMKALAEDFIETELHVRSYRTVLTEHLYELDGFRRLFGEAAASALKARAAVDPATLAAVPSLTIRLAGDEVVELTNLGARPVDCAEGVVTLVCEADDGRWRVPLGLDFANERLIFQPQAGRVIDDGSPDAVEHRIKAVRFLRGLVLNGRVEVLADGELLGRTDAAVFANIDLPETVAHLDAITASLLAERDRRRAA